jgi:hypothetical protein
MLKNAAIEGTCMLHVLSCRTLTSAYKRNAVFMIIHIHELLLTEIKVYKLFFLDISYLYNQLLQVEP